MIFLFQVELFSKLLLASQNTEHGCSFSHKKFLKVAVRVPKMVEDAGLEPFFLLPGQACYRYHYILYIYGGAEGNRTPVRNPYMNKTVLRNRQHFINSPQTETGGSAVVTPRPGRTG